MPHILIVDDEKEILDPLKEMLLSEGYHVTPFLNPQRALEFLNKNTIDIAIFDIKMPEMNGYELLTQARVKNPNLPAAWGACAGCARAGAEGGGACRRCGPGAADGLAAGGRAVTL